MIRLLVDATAVAAAVVGDTIEATGKAINRWMNVWFTDDDE